MSGPEDQNNDVALAGEYVLRLLDADEARAFEQRLAEEPALRRLVAGWEADLSPLAETIDPVTPPPAVKRALQTQLFPKPAPASRGWRSWLAASLVAAGLGLGAVLLVPFLTPDAPLPSLSASVVSEDGGLIIAASFFAEDSLLTVARQAGTAPSGRVLELWLIADGATAPVSLGVLSDDVETRLSVPAALAGQLSGGILAVSDEPPGGSPTGAPTGSVLATGAVSEV